MGQLSKKLRSIQGGVAFWCPGCEEMHQVRTGGSAPWQFDGNVERPTFSPSVLVTSGHYISGHQGDCWCDWNQNHPNDVPPFICSRCHTFVRNGRIEFLSDCTHALAGQTVDLPDLPTYLQDTP